MQDVNELRKNNDDEDEHDSEVLWKGNTSCRYGI